MARWKAIVYCLAAIVFFTLWGNSGWANLANDVNNLQYPTMVFGAVEWIDHRFKRDKVHKMIEELHSLHIGHGDDTDKPQR